MKSVLHLRPPGFSPGVRVGLYACALTAFAAVLLLLTPDWRFTPDRSWQVPVVVLAAGFALVEGTALHVEIRKETHSLSLSSIPMMFGLLHLSPLMLVVSYIAGSAVTLLTVRRLGALKTLWNLSLFAAEAALASFVLRSMLGTSLPARFVDWAAVLGAILAAELLSLLAVPLVIMAVDGRLRTDLFERVGQSQILAVLAGTFTVTAVSASISSPAMAIYAAVPLIGVSALLRSHGRLVQRHNDLEKLHSFTRALTNELGPRALDTGLTELVDIMRSYAACLLVVSDDPDRPSTLRALVDHTLLDLEPGPLVDAIPTLLSGTSGRRLSTLDQESDASVRAVLDHLEAKELVGSQVLAESDRLAFLFVTDRLGVTRSFSDVEVNLFASLARTLSQRLSNNHLIEQLEIQSMHDPLTGLPNRLNFEAALSAQLADPDRPGVLAMVDLDRFKLVNDMLGHDVGDQLLIEIAGRLTSACRGSDMVSRVGGDEFAIFLAADSATAAPDFNERLSAIHARITGPAQLEGVMFEIGASIGAVRWPEDGSDIATLVRRADGSMQQAKANQLDVSWYHPHSDVDAPRLLALSMDIRRALIDGDLEVHLQPKIAVADGRITGAEALIRWTHAELGPISPVEFIALIHQAGLTSRLARFVLREAVESVRIFRDAGLDIAVAVNLTPRDLLDPSLPTDIEQILSDSDLGPDALIIEVTEDAVIVDFDTSIAVLERLRGAGVKVSIDDFGTGYSSLQHVHLLPCDQLKVDRSFVMRLSENSSAAAIVRASTSLAHELGLSTVAEGVEDETTLRAVAELGCQEIQGYLISRPVPPTEFLTWALEWDPARFVATLTASSGTP